LSPNRFRESYRSVRGRPLILAHRGDSAHAPENTLEAAALGHRAGAEGWELDVRTTRDGVPVVVHDESLARTTDVAERFRGDSRAIRGFLVADFDWEEVRALDAGSWFLDPDPSGGARPAAGLGRPGRVDGPGLGPGRPGVVRIPTLAEALELTRRLDWIVNVEIKSATAAAVLGAIRETATTDRVAVSSFDHAAVAEVARLEPGVATGALFDRGPEGTAADRLALLGVDALHISVEGFAALIDGGPGVPVLVYTVNEAGSPGLAGRLAEAGVAGLFTDDPAPLMSRVALNRPGGRTRSR